MRNEVDEVKEYLIGVFLTRQLENADREFLYELAFDRLNEIYNRMTYDEIKERVISIYGEDTYNEIFGKGSIDYLRNSIPERY